MKGKILLVDDEPHILKTMTIGLRGVGYDIASFERGEDVLSMIDSDPAAAKFDVAFIDLMMFPMNGLTLMQELHRRLPNLTIVIITAHGTVETAVAALKQGAYDYLQKPFELQELIEFVERVVMSTELRKAGVGGKSIITENATFQGVLRMAERVAPSNLTILIEGETGTGKELLADFIHNKSDRSDRPIVKLNCAALSSELIESELFGHARGSFTGAIKDRIGRVEAADSGTLFLDEVGEMAYGMQAKLLRFLQSREYQRVGENETRFAEVRVIAATNRDLDESIESGHFREDLFYRLSGMRLLIPPLRVRKEDILPLAESFLKSASRGMMQPRLSEAAVSVLMRYDWRGNVRELENVMLRAAVLAAGRESIEPIDMPEHMTSGDIASAEGPVFPEHSGDLKSLDEVERAYIAHVIERTSSLEEAARVLQIDSATLWRKRKKYAL